jgi:undecaprenyl-diphosphatase
MIDFSGLTYNFDLPIMQVLQGSSSLFADRFIFVLTGAATWIPLYLSLIYLIVRNNETMKQIGLILGFAILSVVLSDYVVDILAKPVFMRYRPSQDPILRYTIDVVNNYRGGRYGFFSAHASNTMSIALFFCLIVKSRLLSFALIIWSLVNCYTRIYLGVHFPSDVICGIIWGCIVAFVTYGMYRHIAKKIVMKAKYISDQYTSEGYAYKDVYIVLTVLAITLFYALFRSIF